MIPKAWDKGRNGWFDGYSASDLKDEKVLKSFTKMNALNTTKPCILK